MSKEIETVQIQQPIDPQVLDQIGSDQLEFLWKKNGVNQEWRKHLDLSPMTKQVLRVIGTTWGVMGVLILISKFAGHLDNFPETDLRISGDRTVSVGDESACSSGSSRILFESNQSQSEYQFGGYSVIPDRNNRRLDFRSQGESQLPSSLINLVRQDYLVDVDESDEFGIVRFNYYSRYIHEAGSVREGAVWVDRVSGRVILDTHLPELSGYGVNYDFQINQEGSYVVFTRSTKTNMDDRSIAGINDSGSLVQRVLVDLETGSHRVIMNLNPDELGMGSGRFVGNNLFAFAHNRQGGGSELYVHDIAKNSTNEYDLGEGVLVNWTLAEDGMRLLTWQSNYDDAGNNVSEVVGDWRILPFDLGILLDKQSHIGGMGVQNVTFCQSKGME